MRGVQAGPMRPLRKTLASLVFLSTLAALTLVGRPARAATWKTNVNYGANTIMDLYVPDRLAASPAILVALHYCGGNAGNAHSWFQSTADARGFIIIAPGAGGNCFDAGLGRSGERANIVKMVDYVKTMYSADPKRVFAAGASSGACMTQALLASYPDVFAGGSSLAGVPAGAWTGGNAYGWSATSMSAQQWGDKVRNADPGFTGVRPRVQLWQGMGDTTLTYSQAYPPQVAQWTNVFMVTTGTMESIKPTGASDTWARTSYKDTAGLVVVEANSGPSSVPHDLTGRGLFGDVIRFFGLDKDSPGTGGAGGTGGAAGAAGTGGRGGAGGTGGGAAGSSGSAGTTGSSRARRHGRRRVRHRRQRLRHRRLDGRLQQRHGRQRQCRRVRQRQRRDLRQRGQCRIVRRRRDLRRRGQCRIVRCGG